MTPDRYAHDLRRPGGRGNPPPRCEHCGLIDPDDGTESECPALLRAAVDRLTEDFAIAERGRLLAEAGRNLLHRERVGEVWCWTGNPTEDEVESLSCPVLMPPGEVRRLVREVERLTEALRVESASAEARRTVLCDPGPCVGVTVQPAAVEGVELVWVPSAVDEAWYLCDLNTVATRYTAWPGSNGATREPFGHRSGLVETGIDQQAACRWIADRARADGYRVPPHPLGWDVGGGE